MNYVDIARNLASGKGIVQSTLGYNQPFLFDAYSQVPTPVTAQPPLYPIVILLVSRLGVSSADAALLISSAAYAIILLLAYMLARDMYDKSSALLSLGGLLIYAPLIEVSRFAWTESLSIVFILFTFWLLIRSGSQTDNRLVATNCFLAGLATGLAFSTRYALLPLALVAILFLALEYHENRARLQALFLYLIAASIPITLVLGHNLLASGRLIPPSLPSDRSVLTNLSDTFFSTFGNYLYHGAETIQAIAAVAGIIAILITLAVRRRTRDLLNVFVSDKHYLLTTWVVAFTAFIVYERTVSNFDHIDARIMVPAGVIVVILAMALLLKVIEPPKSRRSFLYALVTVMTIAAFAREIRIVLVQSIATDSAVITQSGRLSWVAQNTSDNDLIVGDDTTDIPFYLGRGAAISFSPYPYTIYLTYKMLTDYAARHCEQYSHIYLAVQNHPEWNNDELLYHFGEFIADVEMGNIAAYPALRPLNHPVDTAIVELQCR
jgi:hypothetical protein